MLIKLVDRRGRGRKRFRNSVVSCRLAEERDSIHRLHKHELADIELKLLNPEETDRQTRQAEEATRSASQRESHIC